MTQEQDAQATPERALEAEVTEYARKGYEITSRLSGGVQLKKGKNLVFVELDPKGKVKVTKNGGISPLRGVLGAIVVIGVLLWIISSGGSEGDPEKGCLAPPGISCGSAGGSAANPRPPSDAQTIDPRTLALDPKSYVGKAVILSGRISNIANYDRSTSVGSYRFKSFTWISFQADVPGQQFLTENMIVYIGPKTTDILKGEHYRVWAVVTGEEEAKIVLTGAKSTSPQLVAYKYEALPQ